MSLQMRFDFGRMDLRNTILIINENGLLNGKDKKVKIREFKEMHIAPKGGGAVGAMKTPHHGNALISMSINATMVL